MAEPTVTTLIVSPGVTPFLERTLSGVMKQSRIPDRVVLVLVGDDGVPRIDGVQSVEVGDAKNFGDALRRAFEVDPSLLDSDWLWTLHDDSAPQMACLESLVRTGEEGVTIGIVGPKQVAWSDSHRLLEVGIRASRAGRRLDYLAPGEIDQGQHDYVSDVLAVGTAGMLIRSDVWRQTGGPDPALGPFGDGLELSRRVRLMGYRTVVAPEAKVAHARGSYRDVRDGDEPRISRSFAPRRAAQLYNAMLAQSTWAFVLMLLTLPFVTVGRALVRLLTKRVDLAVAELWAMVRAYVGLKNVFRGRRRISEQQKVPATVLRGLEETNRSITSAKRTLAKREREPKPVETIEPVAARLLRLHRARSLAGGVLGAFLAIVASVFASKMLGGGITGAAWVNLPDSFSTLWHQAWSGWVLGGAGSPGPTEPLLVVWALICAPFAVFGISPESVLTWMWLIAPALAWVSMYASGSTLTHRVEWRFTLATIWVSLPTFLMSWSQGRMPGVLVHIALPLLLLGWMRTIHRAEPLRIRGAERGEIVIEDKTMSASFAALAAAMSLVVVSAAPWTGPALVLIAVVLVASRPRRWKTILLSIVPALVVLLPTWVAALQLPGTRSLRFLLADSGQPLAFEAAPTWQTVLGLPFALEQFPTLPHEYLDLLWFVPGALIVLGATMALFVVSRYWLRTRFVYVVAAVALVMAIVASRTAIAFESGLVGAWPGPALSVAALAFIVAWAGLISPLILEEQDRSYRTRKRLDALEKRRRRAAEKAARKSGESAPSEKSNDPVDDDPALPEYEPAAEDAETSEDSPDFAESDAPEDPSTSDAPDSSLIDEGAADETDASRASTGEPRVVVSAMATEPGNRRYKRNTTTGERVLRPLTSVGLAASLLLPIAVIGAWVPNANGSVGKTVLNAPAISAALEYQTPAATQDAQKFPRHARFLTLDVSDDAVHVALRRGDGRQLADSSPLQRLQDAVDVQYSNVEGTFDALTATDPARADFAKLIAQLLTSPDDASGLEKFAIDSIALAPGSGPAHESAMSALDRNPDLERAGSADVGTLWRARPNDLQITRIYIDNAGERIPVDSGLLGATVDLDKYDFAPGATLVLSERADKNWRATLDVEALEPTPYGWQQAFSLEQTSGEVRIAWHRDWFLLWWIASGVSIIGILIAAIPIRRRVRANEF